eukprot:s15_g32.t1
MEISTYLNTSQSASRAAKLEKHLLWPSTMRARFTSQEGCEDVQSLIDPILQAAIYTPGELAAFCNTSMSISCGQLLVTSSSMVPSGALP